MLRYSTLLTLAFLVFPVALSPSPAAARPIVEVAFVLDTTGSMAGLIEGAKRKIWSIATSIVETNPDAEIRMGLVAYRDIGDDYVTKKFDLTADIQDLYANLLELKARGGGDWPESVNEALFVAVDKLSWSKGGDICRIVFLVGDAPPHMDYAQDMKYPQVLALAKQKDILVNAVQAGGARDTERVWREIAQLGNGRYIPIPQDGGQIVVIDTPYDIEIIELQRRINGTVIPYGPKSRQSQHRGQARPGRGGATVVGVGDGELSQQERFGARCGCNRSRHRRRRSRRPMSPPGGRSSPPSKTKNFPTSLRKLAPAQRQDAIDKNMGERKALNDANGRACEKARSICRSNSARRRRRKRRIRFDRVVEETLRAQVKR